MLDEPCSSLDLRNQALILEWIGRLAREDGLTVLFSTHNPQHALAVADDVMLMIGATEFVYGRTDDALTEPNLAALYGVPLRRLSFVHEGETIDSLTPVFPSFRRSIPSAAKLTGTSA